MTGFLALGVLTAKRMAPPQQPAGARGDRTGRGFADGVGDGVGNARDAKHSPSGPCRPLARSVFHHAGSRDAELPEIEPTNPMPIIQPTDLGTHSPTADPTNRGAR